MKSTTRLINGIEKIVEHFASINRGSNIHIRGGIGVNEKIAVPRGSFPIRVDTSHWHWNEFCISEMHKDGTLDVAVYQVAQDRPVLSYNLSELVPNSIVQKIKGKRVAWGIGVTATDGQWESSAILNIGEYEKKPIIERRDFSQYAERDVYQHLWEMGHNSNIPYLLVAPSVKIEYAIEQFLAKYREANREKNRGNP